METQQIIDLDTQYYMNVFGGRPSLVFDRGEGALLYDLNGKAYVDFLAGIAVNALGYAHPAFTQRLSQQMDKLIHCSNLFYNQNQALLAEKLCQLSMMDRAFLCNSGAEANEGAIKLARRFFSAKGEKRYKVISALNSFHGRTLATLAATGQSKYQAPFHPLPSGFVQVAYNDIEALRQAIDEETCAILLEPIQGESGVIVPDDGYLPAVRALCNEFGLLLIFDEVQTGIGRTGKMFAFEHTGIQPDIMTLAKALGNGIPIGAVLAREHCCAFLPGDHGTTFGGNALASAAGLAVLDILQENALLAQSANKGSYFKARLEALQEKHPCVVDVRGCGLMLGLALCPQISGRQIVSQALEKGFVLNCAGHNTLRFVPPLIISLDQIDAMLDMLDTLLAAAGQQAS